MQERLIAYLELLRVGIGRQLQLLHKQLNLHDVKSIFFRVMLSTEYPKLVWGLLEDNFEGHVGRLKILLILPNSINRLLMYKESSNKRSIN